MTILQNLAKAPINERGYGFDAKGTHASIYLYGIIGIKSDNMFGIEGVTASDIRADLKKVGNVNSIDLRIHSEGGSVTEAEAILTSLTEKRPHIVAHIDGVAASAASYIALVGNEVRIADGGYVMIHEARCGDDGTIESKKQAIDLLGRVNAKIVQRYAAKTKKDPSLIAKWMADEKWFLGQEAVDAGFADKVVGNMRVSACINRPDLFKQLPAALKVNAVRAKAALDRIAALKV